MKAIILAAGYATRLYPLTLNTPKCLLDINGKSILDHLCGKLERVDSLDEIIIVSNAKFFDQLENWNKNRKSKWPVKVLNDGTSSNETRLGAIGDLRFAIDKLGIQSDILMLASDNLFDAGLEDFTAFAKEKKDGVVVGLHDIGDPKLAAKKYGILEINENSEVTRIEEKPEIPKSTLVSMGVYYFPSASLRLVDAYLNGKEAKDAPGFYIRWLLGRKRIFGFLFSGAWYDIGELTALESARKGTGS